MQRANPKKQRPPVDEERLGELALAYVAKYATTRAKLASYLRRKVLERGWAGSSDPPIERLVERFSTAGLVDDRSYALSKSRSLGERGYGSRRVRQALAAAGINEEDALPAREVAEGSAVEAALKFARRRRIGPFADSVPDRNAKQKAIAAMIRAGHGFELSRAVVECAPGVMPDMEELKTRAR